MLAPKCATYNGRLTFANPRYLKKAQSEKPRLYEIPYDTSDPANRFAPDREETMTLDNESRSKLNKDYVKPYDSPNQDSLYEIFKGPSLEYLYQLISAKKIRRTCGRKHFEYVKSLEKEIDELESEKADFSNMYDLLLEECVSKDVICSYLHSLSELNAHTELQCMYLHKVKECECLAQKLSKQTESVNNEVHNKLLKSFAKLEKHSISLELSLQHCKEQMKNNPVCKENASNVFRKEREQYHEIQDLKAQMQDKNMVINELKKLILVYYPHVSKSSGVNHTISVSRPQLKCYQDKDQVVPNNSQVKFKKKEVEDHHRISNTFKKTKYVTAYPLKDVNARTKKPKVVPISASKPKRKASKSVATPHKKTVALDTTIQKSKSYHKDIMMRNTECRTGNGNDQFAPILGYGDLNQGNVMIKRVYYVEGLNHNLFSVGQFCDADLEVAFRKSTCFVRDLQGNDLLTGNRGSDLYTISLQETTSSTPHVSWTKASPKTQAWLCQSTDFLI
ncbi:hypothetical protein Tco_0718690 [Tanacetum coccineum]